VLFTYFTYLEGSYLKLPTGTKLTDVFCGPWTNKPSAEMWTVHYNNEEMNDLYSLTILPTCCVLITDTARSNE